jgi:hypothetical protein
MSDLGKTRKFVFANINWVTVCPGVKNKQRAIIQKLGKAELLFLCTAHLLNEIHLPTKGHVDTCCFKVMSQTRKADGQTDGSPAEM